MNKIVILISLLILSFNLYAKDSNEIDLASLLHKTHAQRTFILMPFYDKGIRNLDSIQIFRKINAIRYFAEQNEDFDLRLEAELLDIHYYAYRPKYKNTIVIPKIDSLLEVAIKNKVDWLIIRCHSLLGNHYFYMLNDYEKGFEHFSKTTSLLKNVSSSEFPLKGICYYHLAYAYWSFKDYTKSIHILKKAESTSLPIKKDYYYPSIINTIGSCYLALNNIDSSNFYFNKVLHYAINVKDRQWEGISSGNLGYNLFLEKKYHKAIPMIELDIKIGKEYSDWNIVSNGIINLGETYIALGRFTDATALIQDAKKYARLSNELNRQEKLYPFLAKLASINGDRESVNKYIDSIILIKDSLNELFYIKRISLSEQKLESERIKRQKEFTIQKKNEKIYARNVVILILVVMILIVFCFFYVFKTRIHRKQRNIENEKNIMHNELKSLEDISNVQKKIIAEFKTKLETSNKSIKLNASQLEIISELKKSTILTDDHWQKFSDSFSKVYPKYIHRAKEHFNNLSPADIRYLSLSKLELNNKEMAQTLGVSLAAIRQMKSRLNKKIKASISISLDDIILNN